MSNGSPGYFEDWNEFLTYLNGIANTAVFDKFRRSTTSDYHYNSTIATDPDPAIKVTPAIEDIAAQLVHMVSSDPRFESQMADTVGGDEDAAGEGTGNMMERGGWYLETTIFDPDNADMEEEEPYIFLVCTQVGRKNTYLYGLLLSFVGTPKDPILNSFQLIAQRYHPPYSKTTDPDGVVYGWREDAEEPKEWSVPNWAYIYSETPFITPRGRGVINFPYMGWTV
jgi:hypothetical protein